MKRRNLIITISAISLSLILTIFPLNAALTKANIKERSLSSEITATSPGVGETICLLPEAVSQFYQMDDLVNNYASKAFDIGELTPYSSEIASWANTADMNKRRELFNKYDLFKPTNNVLAWNSTITAKKYRVIISRDKNFTTIEREYEVSGNENSITFINPYSDTKYYWQVIATKSDETKIYSDIFNFTTASLPRTIAIDGVSNTRDLGGNVGLNGNKTKQGLIYRGSGLEAISEEGKEEFKNQLGIKTEIDLRGINEGVENYLSLANYYHYPSPYEYANNTQNAYGIEYIGSGSLVKSFGNAFKALANKDNYPIYFHCSVGRDRTGWFGICLNLLCGVSEEATLKDFILSLFSTSGAYTKATLEFYKRYINIVNYLKTFEGDDLSDKVENYLVSMAGLTHEECQTIRHILLGQTDTGFVAGKVNDESYTDLVKVTYRRYGETPIIKMVEKGTLLEKPNISGVGEWYNGEEIWDFANDTVNDDLYLDFISNDKLKVAIHYSGIDVTDDMKDVSYHTNLDFTMFNKEGYSFKVYDDSFNELTSLLVEEDTTINVVYKKINGYIPKSNSRIIVTAGQSNSAGVGHFEYLKQSLTEEKVNEIKNGYDNVLITGYSHLQNLEGWNKVYADEVSATIYHQSGTFGLEVSLAERFSKLYPDETTYIIKYSFGGASLNYDFISPSGYYTKQIMPSVLEGKQRGWMYLDMVECIKNAIKNIEETTNTVPMIEGLMWMQGESDAGSEELKNLYLPSFNAMIDDFTNELKDNISYKFAVYDAAIAETYVWPYAKQINTLKKSRQDSRNVYIETNNILTTLYEPVGNAPDTAHYDAASYIELGHMFADAYMLHNDKNYKHNKITISAPTSITLKIGEEPSYITNIKTYFNDEEVSAKLSLFSQDLVYFNVNENASLSGLKKGSSKLRITAYYSDEVATIELPIDIID